MKAAFKLLAHFNGKKITFPSLRDILNRVRAASAVVSVLDGAPIEKISEDYGMEIGWLRGLVMAVSGKLDRIDMARRKVVSEEDRQTIWETTHQTI